MTDTTHEHAWSEWESQNRGATLERVIASTCLSCGETRHVLESAVHERFFSSKAGGVSTSDQALVFGDPPPSVEKVIADEIRRRERGEQIVVAAPSASWPPRADIDYRTPSEKPWPPIPGTPVGEVLIQLVEHVVALETIPRVTAEEYL